MNEVYEYSAAVPRVVIEDMFDGNTLMVIATSDEKEIVRVTLTPDRALGIAQMLQESARSGIRLQMRRNKVEGDT